LIALCVCACSVGAAVRKCRTRRRRARSSLPVTVPSAFAQQRMAPESNNVGANTKATPTGAAPPGYATATGTEPAHYYPLSNDAPYQSYLAALDFIRRNPVAPSLSEDSLPPWQAYSFFQPDPATASTHGVKLDNGGLVARFSQNRDTSLQSQYRAPFSYGDETFYFEVTLRTKAARAVVAIGLASRPYPPFRLPGWEPVSVGYHSDDGRKFINDPHGGRDYAVPFGQGDTIGCGYRPRDGLVFFTRNGQELGVAGVGVGVGLGMHPTIGSDGKCALEVNFGRWPFAFATDAAVQSTDQDGYSRSVATHGAMGKV